MTDQNEPQSNLERVESFLELDLQNEREIWLKRPEKLRSLVGTLGMLLPLALWLILFTAKIDTSPLDSISHYYYTPAGPVFTMILGILAIFFIIYKYKGRVDFYITTIIGFAALVVALVPTDNLYKTFKDCAICKDESLTQTLNHIVGIESLSWVHYGAAAVFFIGLAYMLFFQFTKSNVPKDQLSRGKKIRNLIYRVSAIIIILSIIAIFILGKYYEDIATEYETTFWLEVVAIEVFGISWFAKGHFFVDA